MEDPFVFGILALEAGEPSSCSQGSKLKIGALSRCSTSQPKLQVLSGVCVVQHQWESPQYSAHECVLRLVGLRVRTRL